MDQGSMFCTFPLLLMVEVVAKGEGFPTECQRSLYLELEFSAGWINHMNVIAGTSGIVMCRTNLHVNTVRLWSDFGATPDSDGVLASGRSR